MSKKTSKIDEKDIVVEDDIAVENNDTAKKKQKTKKHTKKTKEKKSENKADDKVKVAVVDESYLRLQADFDNYRKRVLREKEDLYQRANEDIMEELLPVLDHLELALQAAGDKIEDPVVQGFSLVGDQLRGALAKFGLSEIEAAGCEFDPNYHEAIMHMPTAEVEENYIVSVARKGYKLGERLLRAAQVVVSSGAPEEESTEEEQQ
jgi:molecular chaperone GrpE